MELATGRHTASLSRRDMGALLLLVLVTLLSLAFLNSPGTSDVRIWTTWTQNAQQFGLHDGYLANQGDYPPLSILMLFLSSKISALFGGDIFAGIKYSLALYLLLTSAALYVTSRNILLVAVVQLALTLNCMALGYLDAYFTPTFILAMYALSRRKLTMFAVLYTISFMIKWQSVILLPFLCVYLLEIDGVKSFGRVAWGRIFKQVVLPCALIVGALVAFYGTEVPRAFVRAMSHKYPSANALNLNWVVTHFLHLFSPDSYDPLNGGLAHYIRKADPVITIISRVLFGGAYLAALGMAIKREKTFENLLLASLLGFLAYFTFNIGVHENHLYLAGILAVLLYISNPRYAMGSAVIVLFCNINLFLFYGIDGQGLTFNRSIAGIDSALLFSIFWVAFVLMLFGVEAAGTWRRGDAGTRGHGEVGARL